MWEIGVVILIAICTFGIYFLGKKCVKCNSCELVDMPEKQEYHVTREAFKKQTEELNIYLDSCK
jgi:hypothetical protein